MSKINKKCSAKTAIVSCLACRAYGIPLDKGYCKRCIIDGRVKPEVKQPGTLPFDLLGSDGRTTNKRVTYEKG